MMANTPATFLDSTARATRTTENTGADWGNGMNWGSCHPGIGIAVGPTALTGDAAKWTLLDQNGTARTPQDGQSIGGIGLNGGSDAAASVAFSTVQPTNDTGDGDMTALGAAHLVTLAAGWVTV
jgi:hypothetical protein